MKIAVPYENGQVFPHFGQTKEFKIYEVRDDEILSEDSVSVNEAGHSALVDFLLELKVNVLICGGIGVSAVLALRNAGVQILGGASGSSDDRVRDFLNGTLHFEDGTFCSSHSEDGEEECDGNISACGAGCCHS